MEAICCQFTIFPIHHSQQKNLNQLPNSLVPQKKIAISPYPLRTNSLASNLLLAVTEVTDEPKPRDITEFLQNAGLLLFVYYIANFVAPDIISKRYAEENTEENKIDKEESTSAQAETTTPISKGFNSTSAGSKKKN